MILDRMIIITQIEVDYPKQLVNFINKFNFILFEIDLGRGRIFFCGFSVFFQLFKNLNKTKLN